MSMPDLDKAAEVIARASDVVVGWSVADAERASAVTLFRVADILRLIELANHTLDAGLLLHEGFVAVPREPTEAMLAAAIPAIISMETRGDEEDAARADAAERSVRGPRQRLAAQYRAMIQAQETQG